MSARCLLVAAFLLASSLTFGQEQFAAEPPAVRLGTPIATLTTPQPASSPELPPLFVPPEPVPAPCKLARPCANDYRPSQAYVPNANPDASAGNCGGECHDSRRFWTEISFVYGRSDDLGVADRKPMLGFMGEIGYWLDDEREFGILADGMTTHGSYQNGSTGPWQLDAPVTVTAVNAGARLELFEIDRFRFDGLVGYQYLQLHEKLFVGTPAFALEQTVRDQINGARIGMLVDYRYGSYFAEALGALTIGRNSANIRVNGVDFTDSPMSLVPEVGLRMGYQLGEGLWCTLGYTFMYMTNVQRPGLGLTNFMVHGITIGFETHF